VVKRSAIEPIVSGVALRGWDSRSLRARRAPGTTRAAAEIGCLFRDLRRALHLPLPQLAARLGTRIEVIEALEAGEARRLPPWPETARVVTAFTGLAMIDPRPVLGIIRQLMDARASSPRTSRSSQHRARALEIVQAMTRPATAAVSSGAFAARRMGAKVARMAAGGRPSMARLGRRGFLVLASLSLAFCAYMAEAGGLTPEMATSPFLARVLRGAQDYLVWQMAPTREGLKWIEVDDPRTRRGDRLETTRR
jgi:hypothetical protein